MGRIRADVELNALLARSVCKERAQYARAHHSKIGKHYLAIAKELDTLTEEEIEEYEIHPPIYRESATLSYLTFSRRQPVAPSTFGGPVSTLSRCSPPPSSSSVTCGDMESLSSYDKGQKSFEGRRYWKDIEAGNEALDAFMAPIHKEVKRRVKGRRARLESSAGVHHREP